MKRLGIVAFVLIVVLAFIAGYWPQHTKLLEAQAKLVEMSTQLANAESTNRLCQLQDQLLTLVQVTGDKNYADASALSTKFFDEVRSEARRTTDPALKSSLESVLNQRDAVTVALAQGDPAAHELLVQLQKTFRLSIRTGEPMSPPQN